MREDERGTKPRSYFGPDQYPRGTYRGIVTVHTAGPSLERRPPVYLLAIDLRQRHSPQLTPSCVLGFGNETPRLARSLASGACREPNYTRAGLAIELRSLPAEWMIARVQRELRDLRIHGLRLRSAPRYPGPHKLLTAGVKRSDL